MFDIGWSELLVVAVVAIVVVGPKELPRMLRAFGKTMGQVRRTANDFRRQFDEALREAEREAGLEETRKDLQKIARADPLKDVKKDFDDSMRIATAPKPAATAVAPPKQPASVPHEAAPAKTGATAAPAPVEGSDAA
jgi:sec-independent protein translocase protein TatB